MANIFQKLFQRFTLQRIHDARGKKYSSLDSAKSIGFVFNVNEPGMVEMLNSIRTVMAERKKKYSCVGIDLNEEPVPHPEFLSNPNILNISRKELNWFEQPQRELVDKFINEPFDILFDLTASPLLRIFPVDYLVKSSHGRLKVAISDVDHSIYDLMFIDNSTSKSPAAILQEVFKYLTDIKSE